MTTPAEEIRATLDVARQAAQVARQDSDEILASVLADREAGRQRREEGNDGRSATQ